MYIIINKLSYLKHTKAVRCVILTFWLIRIISISSRLMKRLNVSSMSLIPVSKSNTHMILL